MIALLAWTLWASPAAAAPSAEVLALADAPFSGERRLALARALLARGTPGEEGVAALERLLDDPTVGQQARDTLVDVLSKQDAAPRWGGIYARLLKAPQFTGRDRIEVLRAELRLADPRTHASALADLDRLTTLATGDTARLIGRALLRGGEPARAATAFSLVSDGSARGLEALAAVAAGDTRRARTLVDLGVKLPGLKEALQDPTALAKADALAQNGFTRAARILLEGERPELVGLRLAGLERGEARLPEATAALIAWRRVHPDDEAARRALVDVYEARSRYADALKLVPTGDPAYASLAARAAFRKAWESPKKKGFDDALAAAWAVAPTDPFIAREWAKSRIAARKPAEALAPLEGLFAERVFDKDALGLYNMAAVDAGVPEKAVVYQLEAASVASTPEARHTRLADVADLLAICAEASKKRGDAEGALEPYFTSLLLDTPDGGQLMGAGGLLWQAQHLEGAEALYSAAYAEDPRLVDALVATTRLMLQTGRDSEALAMLEASTSRDPKIRLLRATVVSALRARDAREAQQTGDLEAARILWEQLAAQYPEDASFRHGLGDTLAGLGDLEHALEQYRKAFALDPKDAWAVLAAGNVLVGLHRPEEARELVSTSYPEGVDPVADAEKVHVVARAWRESARREQAAGNIEEAFDDWRNAYESEYDRWSMNGLAGLYLTREQPEVALVFSDEVLLSDPGNEEALVGRALALEALGKWDDARAAAIAIQRPEATSAALQTRKTLLQRLAVAQSEYQRRIGEVDAAVARLTTTIHDEGPTVALWTALASAQLDGHDCPAAMDSIPRALDLDPKSRWALGIALRAEAVCKTADEVYPKLQEADRRAGVGYAAPELRASRFELDLQRAERLAAAGRAGEALTPIAEAQSLGDLSADEWARLGGVWLTLNRPKDAVAAYEHTLAIDPTHVPAIIGEAGAWRAAGRLPAAEQHLADGWARVRDPRVGLQLVQTLIQQGRYDKAATVLADVKTATLPPEPTPQRDPPPRPLPILKLPSGRTPGERTYAPIPPRDLQPRWLVDAVSSVDIDLARERGVEVVVGAGAFAKPGIDGEQRLDGWYVPVQAVFPPIGLFRPNADVVLVHLDDGVDQAIGVAPAVGIATPPYRSFFATARIGTSPLGFDQVNVLWHGHARLGVAPHLAVGLLTARTPKSDSLLSWAGKTDPTTGQFYGFVSELWLAGYASWTPAPFDLGAQFKGGYTEGYGVDPNPFAELVVWGGGKLGNDRASLHLGGQAVGITNERQEDSFLLPHGGYFSPPFFVMAVAEAKGTLAFSGNRGRLCAALSGGPQYVDGTDSLWFGSGLSATARAGLGASWRVSPWVALGADGRMQQSTSGWHQEAAMAHVTFGLPPQGPSAPTMATTASAGSIVLATDDLCSVD